MTAATADPAAPVRVNRTAPTAEWRQYCELRRYGGMSPDRAIEKVLAAQLHLSEAKRDRLAVALRNDEEMFGLVTVQEERDRAEADAKAARAARLKPIEAIRFSAVERRYALREQLQRIAPDALLDESIGQEARSIESEIAEAERAIRLAELAENQIKAEDA